MQQRSKSDHPWKNCTAEGCDRPLRCRGLCSTCYNKVHQPDRHKRTKILQCFICDKDVVKPATRGNRYATVCSDECKRILTFGTPLPEDHWARWWGKTSKWTAPKPATPGMPAFISNTCDDCGDQFLERNNHNVSKYCSQRCSRRVARRIRKALEHNSPGNFRWVEVIKLWIAAGRRCSYCDQAMTEQPDPDHVVPISRNGRNDMSNIVPCCHLCNSDKGDQTLDEWQAERIKLGKPPLRYVLPFNDPRFKHLTPGEVKGISYRQSLDLAA